MACCALAGAAHATVRSPCSDLFAQAAPLPISAGQAAVLLLPNLDATKFDVQWLDPSGVEIAYDRADAADGYFHLKPRVSLTAGPHTLVYTDDCDHPPRPTRRIQLDFETAPPPPASVGTLYVDYEKYCPDDPSQKLARYWPPPVSIRLTIDPALRPGGPRCCPSERSWVAPGRSAAPGSAPRSRRANGHSLPTGASSTARLSSPPPCRSSSSVPIVDTMRADCQATENPRRPWRAPHATAPDAASAPVRQCARLYKAPPRH